MLRAAESIGFHAAPLLKQRLRSDAAERTFAFLLQRPDPFYAQLGADLAAATRALTQFRGKPVIEFMPDLSPAAVAERLLRLGEKAHAAGIVSVDHPRVSDAIAILEGAARRPSSPSSLSSAQRPRAIGRDNRKEGRTAAWLIAKAAKRPGKVGIIVGSHRFLCQEIAEISFRAYLRENAPAFAPLEALVNLEVYASLMRRPGHDCNTPRSCRPLRLRRRHGGAIAAARDENQRGEPAIVCNELTAKTRAGLIDGVLTAVISTPTAMLAERALTAMAAAISEPLEAVQSPIFVPFELYLPTNI